MGFNCSFSSSKLVRYEINQKNELNITKEEIKKFVVSFGKGIISALFPSEYETLIDIGISTTCDHNKIKSELHQLNLKDNKEVKQIEQQNQKKTKRRKYFSVNAKFYEELKNKNSIAKENTETSMVTSSINLIKSVGKCLTTNIEQTIDEKKNPHIFAKDQLESIIDSNFEYLKTNLVKISVFRGIDIAFASGVEKIGETWGKFIGNVMKVKLIPKIFSLLFH